MNKQEITKIVNSEISNFIKDRLDQEISRILKQSNSKSRTELIDSMKKSIESVYRVLWQKRDFWKSDIK